MAADDFRLSYFMNSTPNWQSYYQPNLGFGMQNYCWNSFNNFSTFDPFATAQGNFNPCFGGFNPSFGLGLSSPASALSGTGSSASENTNTDTYTKKSGKSYLQSAIEASEKRAAVEKELRELREEKAIVDETVTSTENRGTDEQGNYKVYEPKKEFKKLNFWQKAGRFLKNTVSGAFHCGMNMLGVEEFSLIPPKLKVNWKQLGKTVLSVAAIAAATCIPVVGPCVLPALTYVGLGIGAFKFGTGCVKACTTDDPEEFDKAGNDAGEGLMIGGMSALGIKKAGGFSSMYNTAKAAARSDGRVLNTLQKAGNTKMASLGKAYGHKFKRNFIEPAKEKFSPERNNNRFNAKLKETQNEISTRISEIDAKMAATTDQTELAMLQQEKSILEAQSKQFTLNKTNEDWSPANTRIQESMNDLESMQLAMRKGNKITIGKDASGAPIEIEATPENIAKVAELRKSIAQYNKKVQEVSILRQKTMKAMARSKKYAAEAKEYTGKESWLGRNLAASKKTYYDATPLSKKLPFTGKKETVYKNMSDLSLTRRSAKTIFKAGKTVFWDIPFKPFTVYNSAAPSGYAAGYNIDRLIRPQYEQSLLGGILVRCGLTWMEGSAPITKEEFDSLKAEQKEMEEKEKELKAQLN